MRLHNQCLHIGFMLKIGRNGTCEGKKIYRRCNNWVDRPHQYCSYHQPKAILPIFLEDYTVDPFLYTLLP